MGLFTSIMNKIFHHDAPPAADPAAPAPAESAPVPQAAAPSAPVNVEAVLSEMAEMRGGGGNWRTSIVDLLKLLDLDSSLDARKQLAEELNVHAGEPGTAEQNIALSKAVWSALAANGGEVPDSLRS